MYEPIFFVKRQITYPEPTQPSILQKHQNLDGDGTTLLTEAIQLRIDDDYSSPMVSSIRLCVYDRETFRVCLFFS
jgi:hypothetical protein